MPMWMSDHFTNEFGQVMALYEFDLKQMEDEEINRIFAEFRLPEGMDKAEFEEKLQTQKDRLLKGREMRRLPGSPTKMASCPCAFYKVFARRTMC